MRHTGESPSWGERTSSSDESGRRYMEEWLKSNLDIGNAQRGATLQGTVHSVTPTEILIDIGCKADGIVSGRELERMSPEELAEIRVGDVLPVFVLSPEDRDGNVVLSLARAQASRDWKRAEELFNSQEILEARVSDCNRGGVIVALGRLRGFVPASQLNPGAHGGPGGQSTRDDDRRWEHLINRSLKLKVIEIDRDRNRLILSERAATREWRESARQRLLNQLQPGDVCKGVVTGLCDFGAFVDLGGADGLIHLSELSWNRTEHPGEVLQQGQEVEVYVLDVDQEKQRIGLSLRRLTPEPWECAANELQVGQVVDGTITRIVSFGAFAQIVDSVEGLVHISELSDTRVNHPHEVVREGDVVPLKVIRIDADRRRIGLSLKQARDEVDFDWRKELADNLEEDETTEMA